MVFSSSLTGKSAEAAPLLASLCSLQEDVEWIRNFDLPVGSLSQH